MKHMVIFNSKLLNYQRLVLSIQFLGYPILTHSYLLPVDQHGYHWHMILGSTWVLLFTVRISENPECDQFHLEKNDFQEWAIQRGSESTIYPLIMTNIAMENGHLQWVFPLILWFSIVMPVYRRVYLAGCISWTRMVEQTIMIIQHYNNWLSRTHIWGD